MTVFDGESHWHIEPPLVETVVDVTGAGDALTGASIAALMRGLPLQEAAREGVAASGACHCLRRGSARIRRQRIQRGACASARAAFCFLGSGP